jgi:hypothetical protein
MRKIDIRLKDWYRLVKSWLQLFIYAIVKSLKFYSVEW